jgi:hypothetical protein
MENPHKPEPKPHQGETKRDDWVGAVTSAAKKVRADGAPPANYNLETKIVAVQQPPTGPDHPIRDYTVTLEGPH